MKAVLRTDVVRSNIFFNYYYRALCYAMRLNNNHVCYLKSLMA